MNWLKETWARQWHREPDETELRGMVADYLKEVLLAREARELGLDQNDTVIRRRLAQKMEFLLEDMARLAEPNRDELFRYYQANRAHYEDLPQVAFTQIFFKEEASARQGMQALKVRNSATPGDRILLDQDYPLTDERTLANLFGQDFANTLLKLAKGRWQGPVASAYGFHLVWVKDRQAARLRPFEAVYDEVLNDWYQARQEKHKRKYLLELSKKYQLAVEDGIKPLIKKGFIE
ncbi:MAG: peptidylprolyl isomerase [Gammaproteobacteria bacterium]